jgi:hypothetical protein
MSNRLEQFIRDNRESFDDETPSPAVWREVDKELFPGSKPARIFRMNRLKWSVAAALIVMLAAAAVLILSHDPKTAGKPVIVQQDNPDILNEIDPGYAKEVYHFTQLIEIKQNELKQMGKDQPELYRQFVQDITRLDSSYNALKKELPANPNREQLLEAMIQNLQLQTELLNQQLQIIKKIKQSKQKTNEDPYKKV